MHAEVCGILLGSLEGLQSALTVCGSTGVMLTPEESSSNSVVGEVAQRIKELSDFGKVTKISAHYIYCFIIRYLQDHHFHRGRYQIGLEMTEF